MWDVVSTELQLKGQFWFYGSNLPKRGNYNQTEKMNIIIKFRIFKLV